MAALADNYFQDMTPSTAMTRGPKVPLSARCKGMQNVIFIRSSISFSISPRPPKTQPQPKENMISESLATQINLELRCPILHEAP